MYTCIWFRNARNCIIPFNVIRGHLQCLCRWACKQYKMSGFICVRTNVFLLKAILWFNIITYCNMPKISGSLILIIPPANKHCSLHDAKLHLLFYKILFEWFWGFPEQNKDFAIQNMGEKGGGGNILWALLTVFLVFNIVYSILFRYFLKKMIYHMYLYYAKVFVRYSRYGGVLLPVCHMH